MKFSPFVILCCRQAASANPPPEPPGHPLVLSEDTVNGGEIMYRRGGVKMYHGLGGSLSA